MRSLHQGFFPIDFLASEVARDPLKQIAQGCHSIYFYLVKLQCRRELRVVLVLDNFDVHVAMFFFVFLLDVVVLLLVLCFCSMTI